MPTAGEDLRPRNVALLIDADNASWHALDPVLTVLAELGTVNVRRVYGNWSKPALKNWERAALRYGLEPQQQFDLTKGKNATDMKMTIDAMDLLFRGRIEAFGVMSSDSDFTPLATRIRQDGVPIYGFGNANTPAGFQQACTRFIDVAAITPHEAPPSQRPSEAAPATAAPSGRSTSATAAPAPTAAASTGGLDLVLPPAIGSTSKRKLADDPELLKLLIDAYDASRRDERGFVSLSAMGQLAANRSSFDVRNYGFRRLSDLMETIPTFQVEKREGGRSYVKRLR